MEKYTVDYFIKKFEAIPEEKFITSHLTDNDDPSKHCAQGHCGITFETRWDIWKNLSSYHTEGAHLVKLFQNKPIEEGIVIAEINNGWDEKYEQSTPKQRVLAALYDLKKEQQPEIKERIVYVSIDSGRERNFKIAL